MAQTKRSHRREGNTVAGQYDHLNDKPVSIDVTMPALVAIVERQNYGAHRFLSALAAARLADDPLDPLGVGLKRLLDSGVY